MAEIYGTGDVGDSHVMSEKVQTLAASIYQELERMIKTYGDNVVDDLMPLVVGILESLDQSYQEKQENEVELELLRDDNEQLLTQYEREKQLRKTAEQKSIEMEDRGEEERKRFQNDIEGIESTAKMLELKGKNAHDHIARLEEKESEMKKDYNKLHERYTDLFKTHMEQMERTKMLISGDKISDTGTSPRNRPGFNMPVLKSVNSNIYGGSETVVSPSAAENLSDDLGLISPRSTDSNVSLKHELKDSEVTTADRGQNTESVDVRERSTATRDKPAEKPEPSDTDQKTEPKTESQSNTSHTDPGQTVVDKTKNTVNTLENKTDPVQVDNKTAVDSAQVVTTGSSDCVSSSVQNAGVLLTTSSHTDVLDSWVGEIAEEERARYRSREQSESQASDKFDIADASFEEDTLGDIMQSPELDEVAGAFNKSRSSKSGANSSSIYDELTFQDADGLGELDAGADISGSMLGSIVNPGDFASCGMGKEVENLILENTELLATKNALNIVKDDLIIKVDELSSEQELLKNEIEGLQTAREKLRMRVAELEAEVKKTREELETVREKAKQAGEDGDPNDQSDIPMAQRKRFTRVEMARVLMERNQYKERLMELQEAVRWTEMMRASKAHPELEPHPKKKGSIWNLFQEPANLLTGFNEQITQQTGSWEEWYNSFSNLFSGSDKQKPKRALPAPTMHYSPPTSVRPVGDPNKQNRDKNLPGDKARAFDFLQDDALSDSARKEREKERREQYKQVRAHVKKDDGRMQAYGWSLPAKLHSPASTCKDEAGGKGARSSVPVPVPVYCRPLFEQDPTMKIWCAAGVLTNGGRTKDGGSLIGESVFYDNPPAETSQATTDVEKLSKEIQGNQRNSSSDEDEQSQDVSVWDHQRHSEMAAHANMSPFVWICTTTRNSSQVTVIDANNPGQVIETFHVSSSHILCITSVPGCEDDDMEWNDSEIQVQSPAKSPAKSGSADSATESAETGAAGVIGSITFVRCVTGSETPPPEQQNMQRAADPLGANTADAIKESVIVSKAQGTPVPPTPTGEEPGDVEGQQKAPHQPVGVQENVGLNYVSEEAIKLSTLQPTMWLGTQSGNLYVHSTVANWKKCLCSVKLKDSVLAISHIRGRVFVAIADGTVAVLHRAKDSSQWNMSNYHVIDLGKPIHSVRALCVVANKHLWCGYRNKINILNPQTLQLEKTFDAHPRQESQIRQLAWVGDGVWVSIRLDSTLRLYHAYTHQHLQDVDIEPYVSKMLGTGKLGFSFVRITSLLVSCHRLWIGTGNGVIISVPLSESNKQTVTGMTAGRPGGVVRVYNDVKTDSVTPGSFLPYCSMAHAQLSFHGHKDAVKFFVAVPGSASKGVSGVVTKKDDAPSDAGDRKASDKKKDNVLVMSGGEGYIDFRLGDTEDDADETEKGEEQSGLSKGDRSHLIVWQVFQKK